MKLLFFVPYLPSPPVYGGQRRIHGLTTRLAKRHEVSVLGLTYALDDYAAAIAETRKHCREVVALPDTWHRMRGRHKRMWQMRSLLSTRSWEHHLYRRPRLQRLLDDHLAQHSYDAIVIEFSYMGIYDFSRARGRSLVVLDEHNIEYDILRRTASATGFVRRAFNELNWRKLRREEVAEWNHVDGVALVSARDEAVVRAETPRVATHVVPNGVDTEGFSPRPDVTPRPLTLLFFGAMNYFPNTEALVWFVAEVMPLLARDFPNVALRVVGAIPEDGPVPALHGGNVNIVGFVDDIREEIARAHVVIAPLRIGGGTRLKILEAMSMAKPIVATTLGAEGIDITHGHDILIADTPEEQASTIARVFTDRGLSDQLGEAARATAVAGYSWESSAHKLERFIDELRQRVR